MSALFRARAVDFDRLYRDHAPSVYRYAYAVLGNQPDAEDVTQQTFLNAYRAIERGTKPRKAENWLLRIAHNEVRRHFRKNGAAVPVDLGDRVGEAPAEDGDPRLADVLRALRRLPPNQRAALVMREFEGRSYGEIASILEISQSALETLLFRARRGLAEELQDALTCPEAERALSRSLDGRLPRREARRLKEHLRECAGCARFGVVQKRQRSLLKGLSVMPIPASLYLVRGEYAAAAGLGTAAGGSGAVASGGLATGIAAKAAAVAATAAVAGGAGYGVATQAAPAAKPQRTAEKAAVVPVERRSASRAPVPRSFAPNMAAVVSPKRRPAAEKDAKRAKHKPLARAPHGVAKGRATRVPHGSPKIAPRRVKAATTKKPRPVRQEPAAAPRGKRLGPAKRAAPKATRKQSARGKVKASVHPPKPDPTQSEPDPTQSEPKKKP